jgi:hypothetical protein
VEDISVVDDLGPRDSVFFGLSWRFRVENESYMNTNFSAHLFSLRNTSMFTHIRFSKITTTPISQIITFTP